MLESLEFLLILAVGLIVISWHLANEARGRDGEIGLLALKDDAREETPQRRYRKKPRRAPRRRLDAVDAPAAYQMREHADPGRRFRRQIEARYRVKDRLDRAGPQRRDDA
ncbi:MAG: hypothetical protein AAFW81_10180 [Pseudomonadota bacterium]